MDSRPHDDFIQPERSIVDEASPESETTFPGEQVQSPAPAEATGADDLVDAIDNLELELASLLTPDLEAMDLDGSVADASAPEISEEPAGLADGEPVAALAATGPDASGQPSAEASVAFAPEPTDASAGANDATAENAAQPIDADMNLDAEELELALDAMAADMIAADPGATAEDQPVFEEPAAVVAETVVVAQVVAVAEATAIEMADDDGMPMAGQDMPPVVEASTAVASGPAPVAESPEPHTAAPETPVEVGAAAAVASDAAPTEAIVVSPAESAAGGDAPEPGSPMTFEQALDAQDLSAAGFEAAVRGAADRSRSRFLFQMPVHTVADCQRVAAVNLPGDETPRTMLVLLRADGRSYRMEDARESDNPFAGMAVSYGGLLAHLKSLPVRAAA